MLQGSKARPIYVLLSGGNLWSLHGKSSLRKLEMMAAFGVERLRWDHVGA